MQWVIIDGVAGKKYDGIGNGTLLFSPNGNRVAYAAFRGGKWLMVVDGVEGKEYDGIQAGGGVFQPLTAPALPMEHNATVSGWWWTGWKALSMK